MIAETTALTTSAWFPRSHSHACPTNERERNVPVLPHTNCESLSLLPHICFNINITISSRQDQDQFDSRLENALPTEATTDTLATAPCASFTIDGE